MKNFMKAIGVFLLIPAYMYAQSDEDALRYSMQTFGGTARYMGLSGAFGAIGADFSSLSSNPAGIGLFRASDFSFSPALTDIQTRSSFLGNTTTASTLPFNISNAGMVFSTDLTRKNPDNKWKRLNFAFGVNRLNDFNKETVFTGYNSVNSLSDYYVEQANQNGGVGPNVVTSAYPFGAGAYYQTYIIDPIATDTNFYTTKIQGGNVQQLASLDENGSQSEFLFAIGSNYDDHLLIGATLGLPSLHYHSDVTFTETDVNNAHDNFSQYTLLNHVNTNGFGINGKFGFAYILNEYLRAGFAIHTPTLYAMHDDYNTVMNSSLEGGLNYSYQSPFGSYDYDLVTPWRLVASLAGFFGKNGFISADYELVDYASMKYKFLRYSTPDELAIESSLNQSINQKYRAASTIRVGGEYAYDIFRLRAGVAYYDSPFQKGIAVNNYDFARWSYSGGFGVRGDHLYFDFAYVRTMSNEFYQPYTLSDEDVPGATIKKSTNNFVATIGTRF